MPQTEVVKFNCPDCQKEYNWKPEIAGKKAKCKCGTVIDIPAAPPPPPLPPPDVDPFDNPDYMYDLADEPAKATGGATPAAPPPPIPAQPDLQACPNCGGNIPPDGVVCLACGFNTRTGRKSKTHVVTGSGSAGEGASSGSLRFSGNWKAWAAVVGGVLLMCLAPYDYSRLKKMERDPENEYVYLNRRTRSIYRLFGKWGVVGSDLLFGGILTLGGISEALKKDKQ